MPARRFWHPSPDTLVYPYDSIDEAELIAKAKRRSRGRIVLAASALAVSSAVYLICIHGDDLRGGASAEATRNVSAQNGKPSIAVAGEQLRSGGNAQRQQQHPQQQAADVAQRLASVRSLPVSPVAQPAAPSTSGQRQVVPALTDPTRVATAQPTGAEQKLHVEAQPSVTAQQQPTVVAQHPASVQAAAVTPPAAAPLEQHKVVPALTDPTRIASAQPTGAEEKLHVEAQPSATAQQQPTVVAQHPVPVQLAAVTPPVAAPLEQHKVVPALTAPPRVAAAQPSGAEQKLHVETRPGVTAQQPAAAPLEQRQVVSASPDSTRVATAQPTSAEQKLHADARPTGASQQQPAVVPQHLASVRPAVATPPAAAPAAQRRLASATPDPARATAPKPMSAEEKQRADAARYLRAARASMKANNLSAAKSRIAAALAAQPDNRDAQRLRSAVHTLEQQRDALLSLARSCGYIGHLACTSRDAGIALQIDSSSKAARRLATQATREAELQIETPEDAVTGPLPAMRYVSTHH
ncbi:MAG: hypothetical protein QM685_11200 [Paraburkholderia sp.]